tara:strand:- start:129326 stop:129709 length:384 start_codon:yes stop_codon:yes gene_type:complete
MAVKKISSMWLLLSKDNLEHIYMCGSTYPHSDAINTSKKHPDIEFKLTIDGMVRLTLKGGKVISSSRWEDFDIETNESNRLDRVIFNSIAPPGEIRRVDAEFGSFLFEKGASQLDSHFEQLCSRYDY